MHFELVKERINVYQCLLLLLIFCVIFERQIKLTLNLIFFKNIRVLFYKYITVFSKPGIGKYHSVEKYFSKR